MRSALREQPLYEPAAYAKLLNRADLKLWVSFQEEFIVGDGYIEMSDYLASHFGFGIYRKKFYLGVPKKLWAAFKHLGLTSFSLSNYSLNLFYSIEFEKNDERITATGKKCVSSIEKLNLQLRIPITNQVNTELSNTALLSICCMDDKSFTADTSDKILISKMEG